MTHLTKTVRRSTDVRVAGSRPISVELREPGIIVLRERGRRTGYEISLAAVYVRAAQLFAEKERLRKIDEKNARRALAGKAPLKTTVNRKARRG